MVNKKIVIISAIIAILVVAVAIGMEIKQYSGKNYTFSVVNSKESVSVKENNTKEDEVNTVEENEVNEENVIVENKTENEEIDEKKLTGEELAKSLAEKEWGKDDDVYFYLEEKVSDDVYIISVRSKDTTKGLMDYKVNIKTGEISEY